MKQFLTVLVAGGFLAASAWAQTSATGTTTTNTSATTGNTNAQVNTQTQTNTSTSSDKNKSQKQENNPGTTTNTNASTNTSANVGGNSATVASNVVVGAELTKSLDAKKVKPGDPVEAKSTSDALLEGGVKVPRGSKLIGHVTQAQAHSKEQSQSTLGILFDKAETKHGEVPFHAFVQALAAPVQSVSASDNDDMSGGMGGGGMNRQQPTGGGGGGMMGGLPNVGGTVGGVGNTVGQTTNAAGQTVGGVTGNVGGGLNASSQGAVNLPGLKLNTAAANSTNGSVITSDSKTVKLDSGTQLVLRVIAQ